MLLALRRHPLPIEAFFRHSLVLTFAFPEALLEPLLFPGLTLDTYEGNGFLAIALVATEKLRPAGLPAFLGRRFFLSGYRIFSRFRRADKKVLRGLRILRSDADSRFMVWAGNRLTHYNYRLCTQTTHSTDDTLDITVRTPGAEADLEVRAFRKEHFTTPPPGSPFPDLDTARRFAGPLPFTFNHEPQTGSLVIVQGVRDNWHPQPVRVEIAQCTFLNQAPFNQVPPRLANAFLLENIPYRWERGVMAPAQKTEP